MIDTVREVLKKTVKNPPQFYNGNQYAMVPLHLINRLEKELIEYNSEDDESELSDDDFDALDTITFV